MESKIKLENGVTLITHLSTPREKNVNFCLAVGVGHNHETKENLGISAQSYQRHNRRLRRHNDLLLSGSTR